MRPHYSLALAPDTEPITTDQAMEHVRVDSEDDLAYLESLISVGREYVESLTGRVTLASGWMMVADSWASAGRELIPLYRTPLISVESVSYYAKDSETLTVLDPSDYRVISATEPGMVQITAELPELEERPDAVQIAFTAGHASAATVPPVLKHAIKVDVSNRYTNRNSDTFGQSYQLDNAFRVLVENQKVGGWIG